ncbi:ribonuclease [Kaistella treverensis]|uniref:Ribonuclease n=1 Tax=Kaistella treverensis TaxID=631455 RepID=A0A1I3NWP3_9FLAO|nr:ribonuclease domain-containing protein [Kaistella treverensis]SFJ13713.1 ribonuclease [Kaistella treverensis]
MNKDKIRLALFFLIGSLTTFSVMYFINNYKIEKKGETTANKNVSVNQNVNDRNSEKNAATTANFSKNIDELTEENLVINYVKENHELPEYYLTKSEARKEGWVPSRGNLCDVLPGRAIGGDKFSNREKSLPVGNQYFEADVNYNCGNRNADRIVFTKNGEVWLTKNHYKSFEKK